MRSWPRWSLWVIQSADVLVLGLMLYVLIGTNVAGMSPGELPYYYWLLLVTFFTLEVLSFSALYSGILPASAAKPAAYQRLTTTTILLVLLLTGAQTGGVNGWTIFIASLAISTIVSALLTLRLSVSKEAAS